jgi:hypothetical protein
MEARASCQNHNYPRARSEHIKKLSIAALDIALTRTPGLHLEDPGPSRDTRPVRKVRSFQGLGIELQWMDGAKYLRRAINPMDLTVRSDCHSGAGASLPIEEAAPAPLHP